VKAVPGGYQLTRDTDCRIHWVDNGTFLDLAHHTLTGHLLPAGPDLAVRNGRLLLAGGDYWADAVDFTASSVTIRPAPSVPTSAFFIEAGSGLRVDHSRFADIPTVALDFFFGNGGTVRASVFRGNGTAIAIQRANGVMIERSLFAGNRRGVSLWPEDGRGVSQNTIRQNVFRNNDFGITMRADPPAPSVVQALAENTIGNNRLRRSGYSGITISKTCFLDTSVECLDTSGNLIRHNDLTRGGFELPASAPDDDGITARGVLDDSGTPSPYPAALAGFRLSRNRADRNADLGFDVFGVTDGGHNSAKFNSNPAQCVGIVCHLGPAALPRVDGPGPGVRDVGHS
jgi:hypothetical protein